MKMRLDERRRWFLNEWFFKWHFIGKDGPVSIDSFDGRRIQYGGIKFSGTARTVYWDAIVRGVRKEVTEQFAWVDREVRNYRRETALTAIDECAGQLTSFVSRVRRDAVEKDQILRGDGVNFPPQDDAGLWDGLARSEIASQAEALKSALPFAAEQPTTVPTAQSWRRRSNAWWHENQGWIGPLLALLALAGLLPFIL